MSLQFFFLLAFLLAPVFARPNHAVSPDRPSIPSPTAPSRLVLRNPAPEPQVSGTELSPSQSALLSAEYASWTAVNAAASEAARPLEVSDTPAARGITCQNQQLNTNTKYQSAVCPQAIAEACGHLYMQKSTTMPGYQDKWLWMTGHGYGCTAGYWYPKGLQMKYNQTECVKTFNAIQAKCPDGSGGKFNAGSMNVAVLPDGESTGQAVDSGKISWILTPDPSPGLYGHGSFTS